MVKVDLGAAVLPIGLTCYTTNICPVKVHKWTCSEANSVVFFVFFLRYRYSCTFSDRVNVLSKMSFWILGNTTSLRF